MGQVLQADSVASISVTSTTVLTMAASAAQTIGGQQFPTAQLTCTTTISGAGGLDTGSIAASTLYYLYLVRASSTISLVASVNATSPTGFAAFKRIGQASTNASSQWQAAGNNTTQDTGKVGQIISAMLSETQFQAIHGNNWILSDGRSVAGSSYALASGNTTVPDLRGMALRGKNNGGSALGTRGDGFQNPDGDLALGTLQDHTFSSHNHGGGNHSHTWNSYLWYVFSNGALIARTGYDNIGSGQITETMNASGTIISTQGGNETRMRNVTVNHFIKVN